MYIIHIYVYTSRTTTNIVYVTTVYDIHYMWYLKTDALSELP